MSDTFVPLVTAFKTNRESSFASFAANGKTASIPAAKPAASSDDAVTTPASGACAAKPKITLQRTGDIVSSIRIQCGCGEIVELNCVY